MDDKSLECATRRLPPTLPQRTPILQQSPPYSPIPSASEGCFCWVIDAKVLLIRENETSNHLSEKITTGRIYQSSGGFLSPPPPSTTFFFKKISACVFPSLRKCVCAHVYSDTKDLINRWKLSVKPEMQITCCRH